ncbi:MAG: hypothetical protein P1S60_18795 [Anaerolineae bacterium]|nr:hypothetical protein [Anaerolineae bacterium]
MNDRFCDSSASLAGASARVYRPLPARKPIPLYTVLQTLCAMMGSDWELNLEKRQAWQAAGASRVVAALEELSCEMSNE